MTPNPPSLEDITKEVEENFAIRYAMNSAIGQLKAMEKKIGAEGPAIIKTLLNGKRKLTSEEYAETSKRLGTQGLYAVEAMEHLTKPQKQYVFMKMGYDVSEVE